MIILLLIIFLVAATNKQYFIAKSLFGLIGNHSIHELCINLT